MIIKSYKKKEILKKLLNFTYQIRYLVTILISAALIILISPKFFNFNSKLDELNNILIKSHNIKINNAQNINYKLLPSPRIVLKSAKISIDNEINLVEIKKVVLNINLIGVYKFNKLNIKKIKFLNFFLSMEPQKFIKLANFIYKNNGKISIENLNLDLIDGKSNFLKIEKLNLKNISKEKINLNGFIVNQRFDGYFFLEDSGNRLKLKIKNFGLSIDILFTDSSTLIEPAGQIKLKALNNNFIINFNLKEKLYLSNSIIKNKDLLSIIRGEFTFYPFFSFDLNSQIKKIKLNKLRINKLLSYLESNDINKKINGKIKFDFNHRKKIGEKFVLLKFINGNILLSTSDLFLKDNSFKIKLEYNNLQNFKKIEFNIDHNFIINENLLSKFDFNKDKENKKNASYRGFLNLNANKIYFEEVIVNKQKKLSKKKLEYLNQKFKESFLNESISNLNINDLKNFFEDYLKVI